MALSRRTGQRFQGSIWPGFVDAMTGTIIGPNVRADNFHGDPICIA
jgi:hypothetical protein